MKTNQNMNMVSGAVNSNDGMLSLRDNPVNITIETLLEFRADEGCPVSNSKDELDVELRVIVSHNNSKRIKVGRYAAMRINPRSTKPQASAWGYNGMPLRGKIQCLAFRLWQKYHARNF